MPSLQKGSVNWLPEGEIGRTEGLKMRPSGQFDRSGDRLDCSREPSQDGGQGVLFGESLPNWRKWLTLQAKYALHGHISRVRKITR